MVASRQSFLPSRCRASRLEEKGRSPLKPSLGIIWINDDDDSGDTGGDDIPGKGDGVDGTVGSANYSTAMSLHPDDNGWGYVNGTRDLVDFFPVLLDIRAELSARPPSAGYIYRLKHEDAAVNVVWTRLSRAQALDYQKVPMSDGFERWPFEGVGIVDTRANFDGPSMAAITWHVTASGIELPGHFLNGIKNHDGGVVLVEGRKETKKPLVLEISHQGTVVARHELALSLSSVEKMYRRKNLLFTAKNQSGVHVADYIGDYGVPGAQHQGEPENWPDDPKSSRAFVFLHGYNVNPQQARGWGAEMFKRLYWSGSKARFHMIFWPGAETQVAGMVTPDFHINIENAFNAAQSLAGYISSLAAQGLAVTTGAHSLGNMVVASAMRDHGAQSDRHLAFDAAIAIEALDGDAQKQPAMEPGGWQDYPEGIWASEWHLRVKGRNPADRREELTWRNRLRPLKQGHSEIIDRWWNFYSEGEDVLNNAAAGTDFADTLPTSNGNIVGEYGWVVQEKNKGQGEEKGLPHKFSVPLTIISPITGQAVEYGVSALAEKMCGIHGGWSFNTSREYWYPESITSHRPPPADVAREWAMQHLNVFRAHPVFDKGPEALAFLYDPTPYSDAYRVPDAFFNGPGINGYNANKILADMIPARTFAAGRNAVPPLLTTPSGNRNFDINTMKGNGWTSDRDDNRWRHSDLKEVSYYYTFKAYQELVKHGELNK